jgi:hypothetical protein
MKKNEFIHWFKGFLDASEIEMSEKKWQKVVDAFNKIESEVKKGVQIDVDGDGIMDGMDWDGDGKIDEYFSHRQCEHVWGDTDNDGELECIKCGLLKNNLDMSL